ncbi:hypothetical protein RUM44_007891 [Polyplax serrata]|uniref:Uncharacterized protein n=1 Tax=Polyplax serrata TaxID=468196 RepID=A0ABR1BAR6_POLSC
MNETSIEGKQEENKSFRNIPPLIFPEDSDRTVSLDSENDNHKFPLDDQDVGFRKLYWKLSPLIEKCEGKSDSNTASELSSLPEDSDARNTLKLANLSPPSEEDTENAAFPTYSIRTRLDMDVDTRLRETDDTTNAFVHSNEDFEHPEARFQVDVSHSGRRNLEENVPACEQDEDGSRSDCEYHKSVWEDSQGGHSGQCHKEFSPPTLPFEHLEHSENRFEENFTFEFDENTFSLDNS